MKTLSLIFILCTFTLITYSQSLNFEFYNSASKKYNTASFSEQLEKEYDAKFNERIVLLETPKLSDSLYLLQNKILDKLDAESLQLIYITACLEQENGSGYHTSIKTAKEIMGTSNKFRIRLLDSTGNIILESDEVISQKIIEDLVQSE